VKGKVSIKILSREFADGGKQISYLYLKMALELLG